MKGGTFSVKNGIQKGKGLDLGGGGAFLYKTFLSNPHFLPTRSSTDRSWAEPIDR